MWYKIQGTSLLGDVGSPLAPISPHIVQSTNVGKRQHTTTARNVHVDPSSTMATINITRGGPPSRLAP